MSFQDVCCAGSEPVKGRLLMKHKTQRDVQHIENDEKCIGFFFMHSLLVTFESLGNIYSRAPHLMYGKYRTQ